MKLAADAAPAGATGAPAPAGGTLKLAGLLSFFLATYWLQGVAGVWFGSLQPGYIRSFGLSYNGSGIISTMRMLPWWAKLLIAVPQDRFSLCGLGHRLPYAFLGIALGAACVASLGQVSPASQWDLYLFIVMLSSYGIANADAAADGMAVDHAAAEHGAVVQGVMSAGLTLGGMIGGGVAGRLVGEYGRGAAVWWLTAACALALPTVFLTREERPPEREATTFRAVFAALWGSTKQARFVALASFIVLGQLGNSIASQPLDLWVLAKFQISDEQFAYMNVSCGRAHRRSARL
jgi:MFS family permease